MKKLTKNLALALFVVVLAVCACTETAPEPFTLDDAEVVNLDDLRNETDETPRDTGTVVRF